jgi:hypothetical protein
MLDMPMLVHLMLNQVLVAATTALHEFFQFLLACLLCFSDVIIGSETGSLHVTNQEVRGKREGASSLLLDLKDRHRWGQQCRV